MLTTNIPYQAVRYIFKSNVFLIFILSSVWAQAQDYKDIDFAVIFSDCFDNDTISVSINSIPLLESIALNSDHSTGHTNSDIYQVFDTLYVRRTDGTVLSNNRMEIGKSIQLIIVVNGVDQIDEKINLQDGKIVVVDYCRRENDLGEKEKGINIKQHKKKVAFY